MVVLTPMDEADYEPFIENLVHEYAADHIRTGRWTAAEGLGQAREEVARLLPAGRQSPGQQFFSIRPADGGEKVGALWLALEPRGAFVYDLLIFEAHRRRGYAEAAMRAAEEIARSRGARKISLHVFADNRGARRLYEKLGYAETNVMMSKELPP
ncbi:MAG TPA: GNAT family N-acetyltransferase [Thermoplasmata archaeon]|nr:GNAT family N-acetyltransferase [Thermoplasmata archaeon]